MSDHPSPVLEVKDLQISFSMYQKGTQKDQLHVIQSLNLNVQKGEVVAVVGSSGSGKSLLAHAVLGILPRNATSTGTICYRGEELTPALQKKLRGTEIALIPQSVDYLDPLMKVGKQVIGVKSTAREQKKAFMRHGLAPSVEGMYPFQLSGGMARRVLVSTALTIQPKLIVADEPTPGLSVDLAMETLHHFRQLADEGAAVLLITHDLDLAMHIADRIAVFYAGTTVEIAPVEDFKKGAQALRHPYTRAFMDALPQNAFRPITGTQPYAGDLPKGCVFTPRCPIRSKQCVREMTMRWVRGGEVRCIHAT